MTSTVGFLRAGPLGERVRGRREKMADQVRHDEAAEARGILPPFSFYFDTILAKSK